GGDETIFVVLRDLFGRQTEADEKHQEAPGERRALARLVAGQRGVERVRASARRRILVEELRQLRPGLVVERLDVQSRRRQTVDGDVGEEQPDQNKFHRAASYLKRR